MGDQTPRILVSPKTNSSSGQDAIDLAEACGLILDPWQRLCLHETLRESPNLKTLPDGTEFYPWASFEIGLCVARQNGKGSFLEALALAGIVLFGERLIIHSAHEFKTALNAMERLEWLVSKSGLKYKAKASHGAESIEILDGPNPGAKVMFQTRTKGSGLGLTADRIILDEAMMISPESFQALMPTLSSRPNPQIVLTGSAVDQRIHAHCETFGGLRHRAVQAMKTGEDPGRICYLEWSAPEDVDPKEFGERRYWAMSNPGLGFRQTEEKIADEYAAFKTNLRAFGVQRLSIGDWPAFGAGRSEIPLDRWDEFKNLEPAFKGRPVVTLYRSPEGGPWTLAAARRTEDDRLHLDIGYTGTDPAAWVRERLVDTIAAWDPAAVVLGRGGATEVLPELEAAGIEPIIPTLMDEAQACGGLLNDTFIVDGEKLLSHGDQVSLNNGVSNAIKKDLPSGGFVWEHEDVDANAFSQLMGASLSRWALLKYGTESDLVFVADMPTDEEIEAWLEDDIDSWLNDEELL